MLYSIQILRAIAAWIVVAHHYVQIVHGFSQATPTLAFLSNYGAIGVDIFFIISGFVIYLATKNNTTTAMTFAVHRVARILPIYWICTAITAILVLSWPKLIPSTAFELSFFLKSLLFIPSPNPSGIGIYPLVTVGWTLNFEAVFYLIFFLAIFFGKKNLISMIFIGIFLINTIPAKFIPNIQFYSSTIIYEFIIGILIGSFYEKSESKDINIIISVILFSIGIYLLHAAGGASHDPVKNGIPCALIFISIITQEKYFKRLKFFKHLGDWSYSTYLFHVIIISISIEFTKTMLIDEKNAIALSIIGITSISYLSFRFIEKPISIFIKKKFPS